MKESIEEIIESTKILFSEKGWGRNPQEINKIGCSWFAMTIASEIGDEATLQESIDVDSDNILTPHMWVIYKNKCYDAETPEGVDDFLELPIFKRMKKTDLNEFLEKRRES
ncbi:MAG: hypothetical protein OIN87_06060 [Candidatus Methanoperedens sp.]|nr:hypothetical protein [Candidatus Methanoperedens sp.]